MDPTSWQRYAEAPHTFAYRTRAQRIAGQRHENARLRPDGRGYDGHPRAALLAAIAVEALLAAGLMIADGRPLAMPASGDDALQVFWIPRPAAPSAQDRPARAVPRTALVATATRSATREAADAVARPPAPEREAAMRAPVVADDDWGLRLSDAASDPFGAPPAPTRAYQRAYQPDPTARRETAFDRHATRMEAQMIDRSFGGWMQSATKASECRELKSALGRSPESTNTILESMRRRGCRN